MTDNISFFCVRRCLCVLLTTILLISIAFPNHAGAEEESYKLLKLGSKGSAVLRLKERMYALGYFSSEKLFNEFNKTTRERLIELQQKNGLVADGIATPQLQAFIYSDQCLPKDHPDPVLDIPESVIMPEPAGPSAPALTDDGYLPEDSEPYVYASRDEGAWTYVSQDIRVEIRQYQDRSVPRIWLEASVRVRDPKLFTPMLNLGNRTKKFGTYNSKPTTIAEDHHAVFAFSDDFFGYRLYNKQTLGIVIRNGTVWGEKTRAANKRTWPPLDLIAQFADGTMKTFTSDAHTAQEYLDMGVVSTYVFGPILIQDGQLCDDLQNWSATDRAPRMAMGITADGTYRILDVLGRRKDATGVTLRWLAEHMREMGCVEALNLDGGNTTCMIFMGDVINRPTDTKAKNLRSVNGLIGVREEEEK